MKSHLPFRYFALWSVLGIIVVLLANGCASSTRIHDVAIANDVELPGDKWVYLECGGKSGADIVLKVTPSPWEGDEEELRFYFRKVKVEQLSRTSVTQTTHSCGVKWASGDGRSGYRSRTCHALKPGKNGVDVIVSVSSREDDTRHKSEETFFVAYRGVAKEKKGEFAIEAHFDTVKHRPRKNWQP